VIWEFEAKTGLHLAAVANLRPKRILGISQARGEFVSVGEVYKTTIFEFLGGAFKVSILKSLSAYVVLHLEFNSRLFQGKCELSK
jgi:hypothetical protein